MTDEWTDQLSAYLDGELDAAHRATLSAHLRECQDCRAVLEELRGITRWAESYQGREPARDRWPQIETAIKGHSGRRVGSVSDAPAERVQRSHLPSRVPLALAAGISLVIVGASSWWLARATAPTAVSEVIVRAEPITGSAPAVAFLVAERYGAAIAEFQRVLLEEGPMLDTSTVRVLREKMLIIDRAISEAREALSKDPNSDYLADHFTSLMRRKLSLLRNAAAAAVVQG